MVKAKKQMKETMRALEDYIRKNTGLQPSLQIPGNYARELMHPRNKDLLPGFFTDAAEKDKKVIIHEIQRMYTILRETYRATKPLPQQTDNYKDDAIRLGRYLNTIIPWANYLGLNLTIELLSMCRRS